MMKLREEQVNQLNNNLENLGQLHNKLTKEHFADLDIIKKGLGRMSTTTKMFSPLMHQKDFCANFFLPQKKSC